MFVVQRPDHGLLKIRIPSQTGNLSDGMWANDSATNLKRDQDEEVFKSAIKPNDTKN